MSLKDDKNILKIELIVVAAKIVMSVCTFPCILLWAGIQIKEAKRVGRERGEVEEKAFY